MMAGTPTTHYQLPTYADADAPDLTGEYNQAMEKIDTQMNNNETAIDNLTGRVWQFGRRFFYAIGGRCNSDCSAVVGS